MTGGWSQGKPVTALMRQLMDDVRDEDLIVADDTPEFYAPLILERWGWLRVQHVRISLTDRGREVLSHGD